MHSQRQRRLAPDLAYASQAARWKNGFKPSPQQQISQQQTDLENALVSELCSSVGSSSFPPREVLQKLLRYLHTLDHDYICELLDDKFENPLWQVKAKALSVLSALLSSADAEFYIQYYSGRLDLLENMRNAGKDMLRKRAEKVYILLRDHVPSNKETPLELMQRMQEEEVEGSEASESPEKHTLIHTSPIGTSHQTPHDLMMDVNDSPRSNSAPLLNLVAHEKSALSFSAQASPQEYPPAVMAAEPLTPPVGNSAFGFLSLNGGEIDVPINQKLDVDTPVLSTPHLPLEASGFSFMKQTSPASATAEPSAFAFVSDQQQQAQPYNVGLNVAPTQTPRLTVFDTLPELRMLRLPLQNELKKQEEVEEQKIIDPIHDAFEGMDANDRAQALKDFDAYKPTSNIVHGSCDSAGLETVQSTEPLREVILEIELPPGPMGVMLDRTILDMTVIERFVPLPRGGRGYLELHPAICPGCALISINSIYVENKGLAEVGPILGSLIDAPKLLRFKKLMTQGRTANPSTLEVPYIPPPLEDVKTISAEKEHNDVAQLEYEDINTPENSNGEALMTRLNGFNSNLANIEIKLKELIRHEHSGQPVADRRNQLAQLHGTVEKIQTQGIDSVIIGERRPHNYEEIKRFRSTLVRRADDLARLIQNTLSQNCDPPDSTVAGSFEEKHPVSAFAFVRGDSNSTVNDPPLGISQLRGESSFQFLNANANPQVADIHGGNVILPQSAQADSSYGFSFLRDGAQLQMAAAVAAPQSFSQAPTSPSSSFGIITENANSSMDAVTNVFAGLNVKESTHHQLPIFAGLSLKDDMQPDFVRPTLYDTLTKSSHGRPMGLRDLEASLRSTAASTQPALGAQSNGQTLITTEPTQSSFAFISTANAAGFESSSSTTQPSSPTAFGFLRGSNSSSTTPTVASSTVSQSQSLQETEPSMFSFISD